MAYENIAGNPLIIQKIFLRIGIFPFLIVAVLYLFTMNVLVLLVGGIIAGTLFLIFGLTSLIMKGARKRFLENMTKIDNGDYLTKWQYSPQEWQTFANEELQRRRGIPKIVSFAIAAASIVLFFILLFSANSQNDHYIIAFVFMGVMVIVFIFLFLFSNHRRNTWVRNAIMDIHGKNNCAYIDTDFLLRGGEYFGFRDIAVSLAKIIKKNNHLIFTMRSQTEHGYIDNEVFVLIPKNSDQEAEEIVKVLSGQKK